MSEQPIYNPNNIVRKEVVRDNVPVYNPNNIVKKEVVDAREFTRDNNVKMPEFTSPKDIEVENTLNFIQENSLRVMKDHEKDILRDMIKNPNTKKEDLSDAIVTLQGKKAKQIGNSWTTPDYYLDTDKNGVTKPIALTEGEKIPAHKDVANIWGSTRQSSKGDSWYTDVAKTAFNIIPNVIEGVVDLGQLGSQLITGDESETLRSAQNSLEGMKFKLDEDIQKPMYNAEGIKEFTDIFDRGRVDLSPETIWGTALSTAGFFGELAVPGGLISKGAKAYKAGKLGIEGAVELSNLAKKSSVFAGSFLTNLGEVQDSSAEAGLTGRAKGVYDMTISSLFALTDAKWGVGGKILSNLDVQAAKKGILDELGKKIVKDAEGNITKESLEQVTKEAIQAYTPIVSSFAKQYGKDVLDETKDEVIQEFIDKAGQNVWDKLSPEEQGKFGTDAFSAKSFGNYINAALSSVAGAGVPSIISAKQEQRKAYLEQSNSAYEAVRSGEKATRDLKTNLEKSFERGDISKDDYDHALLKVNAYEGYNKTAKNLILNDEDKKKMMELAFQKENLEASIKAVEEKDKKGHSRLDELTPLELGVHNSKRDQAKALQKEIDAIVTKSEVIVQPEVSKKVTENVKKEEEKVAKENEAEIKQTDKNNSELRKKKAEEKLASLEEHVKPEITPKEKERAYKSDKRQYEDVSDSEFNNHYTDARLIHKWLRKYLPKKENREMSGKLIKHEFRYTDKETGKKRVNSTIKVAMEDGRLYKLSSSMVRKEGLFRGHTKTENIQNDENVDLEKIHDLPETYVGVKAIPLNEVPEDYKDKMPEGYSSGKTAIMIYNKANGKFLAWGKETNLGLKDSKDKNGNPLYNEDEKNLMGHYETIIQEGGKSIDELKNQDFTPTPVSVKDRAKEATEKIVKEGKEKVASEKASVPLTITKQVRQQLYDLGFSKAAVDMMKPERANKIINEQITNKNAEQESTVNGEKSKSGSNEDIKNNILNKIKNYNSLPKIEKKSDLGRELYNTINKQVSDNGGTVVLIGKNGKIQAKNKDGKTIVKTRVKREQSIIDDEKAKVAKRKKALNAVPTTPEQYIAMVVGRGGRFNESVTKEQADVPSLYKDNKNGYSLEDLYQGYKEESGLDNITEDDFNSKVENTIKPYFVDGGRELAIEFAVESYEKEVNNGITDAEINREIEYLQSLGLTQKEGEVINDTVDSLSEEETDKLTKDIKDGKEKRTTDEIAKDFIGEKGGIENPFDANEGEREQEQEGKDIIRGDFSDDVFQKAKDKTVDLFKKSVELFYDAKEAEGASKKRSLAEKRRKLMDENPTVKYIDDNIKYIYKQLENKGLLTKKGNCP